MAEIEILIHELAIIAAWNFNNKEVSFVLFSLYFDSIALNDNEKSLADRVYQKYLEVIDYPNKDSELQLFG